MRRKTIVLTILLTIILALSIAQVGAIDPVINSDPSTRVRVWERYVSSGTWEPDGSSEGHSCFMNIGAKATEEPYISYYWPDDARLDYGDPPPGSEWKGFGIFVDQDWGEGPLTAILFVQTGVFRADPGLFTLPDVLVLYGRAIVFIGSTFYGIYDFDLVLWSNFFDNTDQLWLVIWTESGYDADVDEDYQPAWLGSLDVGEIVFS